MQLGIETAAAFVGTVAFSVIFFVPKKQWVICGIVGGAGWIVYALVAASFSAAMGSFFAAAVIALLARILAVYCKVPTNVIMIPGIFPIIPGIGLYDMIYDLLAGNTVQGMSACFSVLKIIGAMVLGLFVILSLPQSWFRKRKKERVQ